MRRRILAAILLTTSFALVLFGIPLAVALARTDMDEATIRLEREATLAARAVPADFSTSHDPVELDHVKGLTIGLYDMHGHLFAGAGPKNADDLVSAAGQNRIRTGERHESLVAAIPVTADEHVVGVIRAERSVRVVDAKVVRTWLLLAAFGFLILAMSALIGRLLADRIARRVRQVRDDAVQLGDGNFAVAALRTGIRELDELGAALRTTGQRLQRTLERERTFSADASHQLRTPLTGLRLIIDNALAAPHPDSAVPLTEALVEIDRLEATIDSLLELARPDVSTERPLLDVGGVVRDAAQQWHPAMSAATRPLRIVAGSTVAPRARQAAIGQALNVLLDNAARHGRGTVTIETRDVANAIAISVTDEGPGIDTGTEAIFRRHSTGHGATSGSGIGLSLARSLVEGEGGRLILEDAQPGARFTILLPT